MREISSTEILNYLKAKTPELLRELMLKNNLDKGKFFDYQDIRQLNDGSFICWYLEEIKEDLENKIV